MLKYSVSILLVSIIIALITLYLKSDVIKKYISFNNIDDNYEDKKKYILNVKNKTLEEEFINKYKNLKNELINYKNNNTYLKYEREAINKIKELEIEKKLFEEFESKISEKSNLDFQESELKNLTDLIDRYILSEN